MAIVCPCAVQGDVMICMEVMEASLDQLNKKLKANGETIPEDVLAKIALSVSCHLHVLLMWHTQHCVTGCVIQHYVSVLPQCPVDL